MHSDSWQLLSIFLSVLSVAFQAAGVASPLWIWLDNDDDYVGLGLFYKIGLDKEDGDVIPIDMTRVVIDEAKTMDTDHWLAVGILEIVSGGLIILLIPFIIYHYILYKADNRSTIHCIHRILLLLAALSWMTNASGLLVFIIYHGDILTEGPDVSSRSFCWSGLMCTGALFINVLIHYIIITRFDDTFMPIPSGGDPNINQFASTDTGLMSRYYQADANNVHNRAAKASVDGLHNGVPPLSNAPNGNIRGGDFTNTNYIHDNGRRLSTLSQPQTMTTLLQNDRVIPSTDYRTDEGMNYRDRGSGYQNTPQPNHGYQPFSYYQGISGNLPRRKDSDIAGRAVATTLQRSDSDHQYYGGRGRYDQEFVFSRDDIDIDQTQVKRELVRETEYVRNVRKESGDFLVSAKHGSERDPHRQQHKYMAHTKGKSNEDDNRGDRVVLSPLNFTEGNVKYNPSYIYRPYSEQTY